MLRALRDWVVYTNVFLAVGAGFMGYATCVFLGLQPHPAMLSILFFGTFAIYTTNRFTDLDEDRVSHPVRYGFVMSHRKGFLALAGASYAGALGLALTGGPQTVWAVMVPAVLSLLYNVKWMPALSRSRLKEVTGVKNVTVALAWAIGTVLVPVSYVGTNLTPIVWLAFAYTFVLCFVNTVLFDVRDVRGDARFGIGTIPVRFGVRNTKRLSFGLLGMTCGGLGVLMSAAAVGPFGLVMVGAAGYLSWAVWMSGRADVALACEVLADGFPIVYGCLALLCQVIV